jgi:hypothetical protein
LPFGVTIQRRGFPSPVRDQLLSSRAVVFRVFLGEGAARRCSVLSPPLSVSIVSVKRGVTLLVVGRR